MLARNHLTVYPAIDVLDGRIVRLEQGRRERVTVEGGDPVAAARRFAAEGAEWLHLVDLDGAFAARSSLELVRRVASATNVPVQVGGGLRTLEAVEAALDAGAARALVGTAALDPAFVREAAARFGDRMAVAVDARDGVVVADGWTRGSGVAPGELARACADAGVTRLLVTATRRDGTLAGPDVQLLEDVLGAGLPVIAAGGVASLADLVALRALGCEGAVAGSALWRGRFTLAEALATARAAS
ncbi:MAG TPA: 1-(5-phosphoribosyl)-5-[(5-phosphoribosylamino)methylideneamino] imidazole-4-carboxamide isomerase [Gaiellaceae bacterium]|nr:1-(5-phosphoribosyl)-5-[(5-phosphoribosylamino)methylideneamino] imidazole-4-carboxamide isomerase [Gaiellaceae bacterium]